MSALLLEYGKESALRIVVRTAGRKLIVYPALLYSGTKLIDFIIATFLPRYLSKKDNLDNLIETITEALQMLDRARVEMARKAAEAADPASNEEGNEELLRQPSLLSEMPPDVELMLRDILVDLQNSKIKPVVAKVRYETQKVLRARAVDMYRSIACTTAFEVAVCGGMHLLKLPNMNTFVGGVTIFHLWALKQSFDLHWFQRFVPLPVPLLRVAAPEYYIPWDSCIEMQGSLDAPTALFLHIPFIIGGEIMKTYSWVTTTGWKLDTKVLWFIALARCVGVSWARVLITRYSTNHPLGNSWFDKRRGGPYVGAFSGSGFQPSLPAV
eukprot:PhF_6_TR38746/c0_g1_i2/m.58001